MKTSIVIFGTDAVASHESGVPVHEIKKKCEDGQLEGMVKEYDLGQDSFVLIDQVLADFDGWQKYKILPPESNPALENAMMQRGGLNFHRDASEHLVADIRNIGQLLIRPTAWGEQYNLSITVYDNDWRENFDPEDGFAYESSFIHLLKTADTEDELLEFVGGKEVDLNKPLLHWKVTPETPEGFTNYATNKSEEIPVHPKTRIKDNIGNIHSGFSSVAYEVTYRPLDRNNPHLDRQFGSYILHINATLEDTGEVIKIDPGVSETAYESQYIIDLAQAHFDDLKANDDLNRSIFTDAFIKKITLEDVVDETSPTP